MSKADAERQRVYDIIERERLEKQVAIGTHAPTYYAAAPVKKGVNKNGGGGAYKHNGTASSVLNYLRQKPNVIISYQELDEAIGATSAHSVPNAITHLKRIGAPIERPMRGSVRYNEAAPESAIEPEPAELSVHSADAVSKYPDPPYGGALERTTESLYCASLYEEVGQSHGITVVRSDTGELFYLQPLLGKDG